MKILLALCGLLVFTPLHAPAAEDFDPDHVDVVDAIACRIGAPAYNGFALSVAAQPGIAGKRRWKKVASGNPFMTEYRLPTPIHVAGRYSTRRIAFTATAILAILDLEDPATIAREENVENAANPESMIAAIVEAGKATRAQIAAEIKFRKFLGERVMVDLTEPAGADQSFGTHTVIARSISNATTHPGKTLYGCSYRIDLLDKDGKPL